MMAEFCNSRPWLGSNGRPLQPAKPSDYKGDKPELRRQYWCSPDGPFARHRGARLNPLPGSGRGNALSQRPDIVYPGALAAAKRTAVTSKHISNSSSNPLSKGSYARCHTLRQLPEMEAFNCNLHFAGVEHTNSFPTSV